MQARRPGHVRSARALFAEADLVSLHVPLLPETHHLVDAKVLMNQDAILVDSSRGGLVDTGALLETLR